MEQYVVHVYQGFTHTLNFLMITKAMKFSFETIAWQVVFKIPFNKRPTGHSSIMAFWKSTGAYNDGEAGAMNDFSTSSKIFKSSILDDWVLQSISAVSIQLFVIFRDIAW